MFVCMCASEECQVNGCARIREKLEQDRASMAPVATTGPRIPSFSPAPATPAPTPTPVIPVGWRCPVCECVNAPSVLVCQGCAIPVKGKFIVQT